MQNQSISTKDAMYIEDMLAWNLLAAKKSHFAANNCQQPALKTQLEECCVMHTKHYETLTNFLSTTSQSSAGMQ